MPMTSKRMIRLLKKHGFVCIRKDGSHLQFYNKETNRRTTVAMHCKDLPKGTERKILKDAGLWEIVEQERKGNLLFSLSVCYKMHNLSLACKGLQFYNRGSKA